MVCSDEEEEGARRKGKPGGKKGWKKEDGWKRSKRVKTKIEHKTYEQIVVETKGPASASLAKMVRKWNE